MKYLSIIFIIGISFGFSSSALSQGNLGQSGANFLQIAVEPRGAALGGAVTALSSGASALYWNPAGAVETKNLDIVLSHTDWFLDTKLMYGAIVKNFGRLGSFGVSVTSFYMDEMEITTVSESEGTGQYYGAGDLALGVSYARSLTDQFTFGVTAKYVREEIWNESASQIAFDVGSLYHTGFYNLRIGMSILNFTGKMKFTGDDIDKRIQEELDRNIPTNPRVERLTPEFRLPQLFQMGIAFDPVTLSNGCLTLLADVIVPADNKELIAFGAEYNVHNLAYLRAAYRLNYDIGGISFGGGLHLNAIGMNARIDYSYSTQGVLGNVHRFGLGFSL